MGTLSGEAWHLFSLVASPSHWGPLLKERVLYPESKFFPLRVDIVCEFVLQSEEHRYLSWLSAGLIILWSRV